MAATTRLWMVCGWCVNHGSIDLGVIYDVWMWIILRLFMTNSRKHVKTCCPQIRMTGCPNVAPEPPIPFPKVHLAVFLWEPLYLLYAPQIPKTISMETVINDFGRWFLLNASSTLNSSALSFFTSFPKFHESRLDAVKHHVVRDHNALGPLATEELVVARLGPCQLPCIWNHKVTASYSIKEMGT